MNIRIAPLLALLALVCATPVRADWMERTEAIMGTRCYVELWADDPVKGNDAIDAVMGELRRIDNLMSHYKPESELSQINQYANERPVQVDKELFDLIKLSTMGSLYITRPTLKEYIASGEGLTGGSFHAKPTLDTEEGLYAK